MKCDETMSVDTARKPKPLLALAVQPCDSDPFQLFYVFQAFQTFQTFQAFQTWTAWNAAPTRNSRGGCAVHLWRLSRVADYVVQARRATLARSGNRGWSGRIIHTLPKKRPSGTLVESPMKKVSALSITTPAVVRNTDFLLRRKSTSIGDTTCRRLSGSVRSGDDILRRSFLVLSAPRFALLSFNCADVSPYAAVALAVGPDVCAVLRAARVLPLRHRQAPAAFPRRCPVAWLRAAG